MSILLLGGNGFIGSHLAERLRDAGMSVTVLDSRPMRGDVDWRGIEYRRAAADDAGVLDDALAVSTTVVHLAHATVPFTANADPSRDVSMNLIGTLRLIEAMRRCGRRRLVYVSSGGTVYGDPGPAPVVESCPLRPIGSYGIVKVAIENYLRMYARTGDLAPLILRPSNVYGPRQHTGVQGIIAAAMARAKDGAALDLWGGGSAVRDYLFVDDLVDLLARAISSDAEGVYNAGSGIGYSLSDICAAIARTTGRSLRLVRRPSRSFDVNAVILDSSAARDRFGWAPCIGLDEGLARTWDRSHDFDACGDPAAR